MMKRKTINLENSRKHIENHHGLHLLIILDKFVGNIQRELIMKLSTAEHHYQDLITLFHACFFAKYNTLLVKGEDEPLYLPADENRPHNALYFAHGFFASALHECAHWLIAGEERRKQIDFGYWYVPDGRSIEQQALFQSLEIKPQAMEWILSNAAGFRFRVSIDNLNGSESDTDAFKRAVHQQVKAYCENGLSARAESFRQALCNFYHTSPNLNFEEFDLKTL